MEWDVTAESVMLRATFTKRCLRRYRKDSGFLLRSRKIKVLAEKTKYFRLQSRRNELGSQGQELHADQTNVVRAAVQYSIEGIGSLELRIFCGAAL